MASDRKRRDSLRKLREFGGEESLIALAADLEKDNERLTLALARADARYDEIAKERRVAVTRAAVYEARCGQIPVWRGIVEDIAAALSERDLWTIQGRARRVLTSCPTDPAAPAPESPEVCLLCLRTREDHGTPPHDFMSNRLAAPSPGGETP